MTIEKAQKKRTIQDVGLSNTDAAHMKKQNIMQRTGHSEGV